MAEKLARSTFETDDLAELSPPAPGTRTSTIESNPVSSVASTGQGPPTLSFRSAVTNTDQEREQFHLVGFEPAYGYRRHVGGADGREEEEEEEEDDFLAWARIIGQGEGRETSSPSSSSNQHRRLGEWGKCCSRNNFLL